MLAYLNDPRVRSVVAGALGGLVGWMVAEVVVLPFGKPLPLLGTVLVGMIVGTGIGVALSGAEGLLIGSKTALRRGVTAGLIAGIAGGLIGTLFGQGVYALAGGATVEDTAGTGADAGESAGPSVFSTSLRQRLEKAGARVGEVEVALSWENRNDLDLWVIDPAGERINWQHRQSRSGGELDVDRNAGCNRDVTNEPVEHVVWDHEPPPGEYRVEVDHYRNCGPDDPTPFVVAIKLGDELLGPYKGQISSGESPIVVTTFEVGADKKPVAEAEGGSVLGALLLRMLGWLVFGALLGCAEGLRRRSATALRNAVIGGAIGGAVGGLLFQLVAWMNLGDVVSRLLGFVVLGACIGLWIVLIERALSAVLAVRNGRYEGRMIFLDRPVMRIGRDDVLEVYLGGDPAIAPHHATVRVQSGAHQIVPEDGPVTVNAQPITGPHTLRDKDTVTIGNTRLAYSSRTAEAGTPPPAGMQGPVKQAPPPPPRPGGPTATSPKPTTTPTRPPSPPPAAPERPSRLPPPPPPPKRP